MRRCRWPHRMPPTGFTQGVRSPQMTNWYGKQFNPTHQPPPQGSALGRSPRRPWPVGPPELCLLPLLCAHADGRAGGKMKFSMWVCAILVALITVGCNSGNSRGGHDASSGRTASGAVEDWLSAVCLEGDATDRPSASRRALRPMARSPSSTQTYPASGPGLRPKSLRNKAFSRYVHSAAPLRQEALPHRRRPSPRSTPPPSKRCPHRVQYRSRPTRVPPLRAAGWWRRLPVCNGEVRAASI